MAKRIGAVDQKSPGNIQVEELKGLSDKQSAQLIAYHFATISKQYDPVDVSQLPSYLPALEPPQLDEHSVYLKLKHQKKTRSTLPIDIPENLENEFSPELVVPLSDKINSSLSQQKYPTGWKFE